MKNLHGRELDRVIELYIKHRNEFIDICTLEMFYEQFCHKCGKCGKIICILDMCEECDVTEYDNDFQEFELNKEHYVYNL